MIKRRGQNTNLLLRQRGLTLLAWLFALVAQKLDKVIEMTFELGDTLAKTLILPLQLLEHLIVFADHLFFEKTPLPPTQVLIMY
jgi:hypothetical protein